MAENESFLVENITFNKEKNAFSIEEKFGLCLGILHIYKIQGNHKRSVRLNFIYFFVSVTWMYIQKLTWICISLKMLRDLY